MSRTMPGPETRTPTRRVPRAAYSLQEFADLLGIGTTKAYELAIRDELPVHAIRVGAVYRFPRARVDRLLGLEPEPKADAA